MRMWRSPFSTRARASRSCSSRLCLQQGGELGRARLGEDAHAGRAPRHRARQSRSRPSTKLYEPAAYHSAIMARDVRALLDYLGFRAPMSWATRWARGSRRSWRSRIPSGCARPSSAASAFHLVEGVGLPETIALALEAPTRADVSDPTGLMFRSFGRADEIRSARGLPPACAARARR